MRSFKTSLEFKCLPLTNIFQLGSYDWSLPSRVFLYGIQSCLGFQSRGYRSIRNECYQVGFLGQWNTWYYTTSIILGMISFVSFETVENCFRIEVHPSKMNGTSFTWGMPVTTNDFALLKLAQEIDLTATPNVKAACWPSYHPVPGDNNVSGSGYFLTLNSYMSRKLFSGHDIGVGKK